MNRRALIQWLASTVAGLSAGPLFAQALGTRPIRMVVGFSAGGPTDIVARLLAQHMGDAMGRSVIVENKPGAGGNIAATEVMRSTPDGTTVLYNTAGFVIAPALSAQAPNPRDFKAVALTTTTPLAVVVHPSVPANTPRELIAHIRANPEKVACALGALGSTPHLAIAQISLQNNLKINFIPYKGAAAALQDVAAGHVHFTVEPLISMLPFVREERVRAIAILSRARSSIMPDLPTWSESTGSVFEASSWQGMVVPAATPAEFILGLNVAVNRALKSPAVVQRLVASGTEPLGGTPEQYAAFLQAEEVRWQQVVKDSGIKTS